MSIVDLTEIIRQQVPEEDRHVGYLVDLSTVTLDEGQETDSSWIHAMPVGSYKHPLYGTLDFTLDRIQRFADNIKKRVRGIDPAIDYDHRTQDKAAGWVKDADVRSNGLWLLVEWTKTAAEAIRNKEYRYFSSDFGDEWTDAEGVKHKDVLFGGGLTNRPFLKNLVPVNLSELYGKGKEKEEDESMELTEQLREALGLSEDATEQDALDAIKKLQETPEPPKVEDPPDPELPKELAENPAIQRMLDDNKKLQDDVLALRTERTLSEVKRLTEGWTTHSTGKFALPPVVTEDIEKLLSENFSLSEQLSKVFDGILETGLVKLSEDGRRRRDPDPDNKHKTASEEVNERVKKLMEDNKGMQFADAYSEVMEDPELYARYRQESFAGAMSTIEEGDES